MKGYRLFMFYHLYEMNHAALQPFRAVADAAKLFYSNPLNPLSHSSFGRSMAASAELFERMTRRYAKPGFGLPETVVDGQAVRVTEEVVWSKPFCDLLHFRRDLPKGRKEDSKLLIVAPMSGHYATLLRGTVEAMMQHNDVYITDWADARMVPLSEGRFDLDDYIDYVIEMLHHLGEGTHVMAVCQPSVPVFAAVSLMEKRNDPLAPASMIRGRTSWTRSWLLPCAKSSTCAPTALPTCSTWRTRCISRLRPTVTLVASPTSTPTSGKKTAKCAARPARRLAGKKPIAPTR